MTASRLAHRIDWDPRFDAARPEHFAPVHAAAERFRAFASWPGPEDWNAALADLALCVGGGRPLRFVLQGPRPPRGRRRRAAGIARESLYDGRIFTAGEVPSRARSWHDFFNMLVWASLPRAKRAMNARQYAAAQAHFASAGGAPLVRLPGARTREQDALAMLDEGGLLVLCAGVDAARAAGLALAADDVTAALRALVRDRVVAALIFGHALYEHLVSSRAPVRACAAVLAVPSGPLPRAPASRAALADALLAARLADPSEFTTPAALPSVPLADALFAAADGAPAG